MMDTRFMLLWFEGPLQSWGSNSKFGRRDTLRFPTKSGVLGLICAALGYSGEQREFLAEMADLLQTVISYTRFIEKKGKPPEKVEQEILLKDFHMVGSGYDDSDPWQKLLIPKTAGGKPAVGGGAKMTRRSYLQDAKFAVIVEIPEKRADEFKRALQNPVYDIYLGRKTCSPTDFVYQGIFNDEAEAAAKAECIAAEKTLMENFRVLAVKTGGDISGEYGNNEYLTLTDVPIQFGQIKKYRDRRVKIIPHVTQVN
ncbi:MAG: type I-E CRISPR-associated protein Cas5/CasD [Treponema sp.]|jgi:CRISPR system Cascade subunit CasD|nr:type I-E CRISPR-associated protein Cas5/CasD [Treponema sp.]